ncbi:uncharacterized protein FTOL_04564 [Fusarium torulosum]|uniref:Uncharacterized protein n=1 Tax=Fusarium torulosum TaxID=33205 RepID=A0AAE8SG82_9HYPO|nr:uncharacterized protein FTOL_04564 [Fusarium torulosum]
MFSQKQTVPVLEQDISMREALCY